MTLTLRYHAHHLELSGYGRAAKGYLDALATAGVSADVQPVQGATLGDECVDVAIYHTTPSRLSVPRGAAKKHVALTTWETDPLPQQYVDTLSSFDAVIVPSAFCRHLLRDVRKPVHVVPHGFDPHMWPPRVERPPSEVFTFYSIGAWGERKNTLGLLKAYLHAFRKKDRVRLVLVVDKVNMQAIYSVLARSLIPQHELPGLVIPDHRLSDEEIYQVHRDGDCFVAATRSEGFGLPIFEAAVMGKPIITTIWGGQTEFLGKSSNVYRVWHAMTPVFPGEDEVSIVDGAVRVTTTLPTGADSSQSWAEPSLERLSVCMRIAVGEFREGRLKDDQSNRDSLEARFSYDAIGAKFLKTLKEILHE